MKQIKHLVDSLVIFGKRLVSPISRLSKKLVLPGFDRVSLYDVSIFFYRGVTKNSINLRASAISFDFMMALAPALIFLFTLIPYLPIPHLQQTVMETIHSVLPENAFLTVQSTVEDIMSRHQGGLLSISFLFSVFFASNGMITLMRAFNQSVLVTETRSNFKLRLISLLLVVIVTLIMILAAGIQVLSYFIINAITTKLSADPFWLHLMLLLAKYIILIALLFSVYSFIYYLAPAKRGMYRFVSAGSTLSTVVFLIIMEIFTYVINHFGHYNKVYGSLGTMVVIFLWININAIILLIGFELNASIYTASLTGIKRQ